MSVIQDDSRFWDRAARKYAADKIADEAGYERTLARCQDYLKTTDVTLEFGCGTGTTALRLAPFVGALVASDISGEMIAIAKEKHAQDDTAKTISTLTFVKSSLGALTLPRESFDVVMGFNAVHMLPTLKDGLAQVHSFLKPGGLFISKTPCLGDMNPLIPAALPIMRFFGKAPHVLIFTSRQLQAAISAAGFEIIEVAHHASKGKDTRPFIVARRL
ncbi:MAG: SAM-dependent methyltransferase [Asticcacaulis sp. 32-58-5]|nr:MAG: SAM-dependent methyltransferase [Asticcacaulis sp. 32-58-5]